MNNYTTEHRTRKHLIALALIVAWSSIASYAGVVIAHLIGH